MKVEIITKGSKQRFPRKLKKACKKAWKFQDSSRLTFEPKDDKWGNRIRNMIRVTREGLYIPMWNGTILRFYEGDE